MNTSASPHGKSKPGFRPDIEGLRAIAILLVAFYHAGLPQLSGGFVGVDIFFVVSGYLITGLLVQEFDHHRRIDFIAFYARRARRLLPAAAAMIVVTLLVAQRVYAPQELIELAKDAITTSLYASNLWFAHISTDYLSADADKSPLLHSWSLAVEEQFYLVWPLLVLLALRGSRDGRQARRRLTGAMLALAGLSFALCLWLTTVAQSWAFFASPTRAWEFAVGALAAQLPAHWAAARPALARMGFWLGLLMIGLAATQFSHDTVFPGVTTLLPVAGTALMLACFLPGQSGLQSRLLHNGLMQWIGSRSYAWYLWHWPVLILARRMLPEQQGLALGLACLALSLLLAEISCRTIENPVRFNRTLARRPVYSLTLALMLTVISAGSSEWWRYSGAQAAQQPDQIRFTRAMQDIPKALYRSNCHLSLLDVNTGDCVYGDAAATTTIVLLGDSHAAQWFPGLEALAQAQQWRLMSFTKSSCPAVATTLFNRQLGRRYTECDEWRAQILHRIIALRPALVVMGYYAGYVTHGSVAEDAWQQGMRTTLSAFGEANIAVAVMRDTPRPGFNAPLCLARQTHNASWQQLTCEFSTASWADDREYQLTRAAADGMTHVTFIDLNDRICAGERCSAVDAMTGMVRYRDSHHLTTEYVRALAPLLLPSLSDIISRQVAMGSDADSLSGAL